MMKTRLNRGWGLALLVICVIWVPQARAAYYTVGDTDFSEQIGDMLVRGSADAPGDTGTGRNNEVLELKSKGSSSVMASNELPVGDLWRFLAGIDSVTTLAFGLDVNEPGSSNPVVIESLTFQIHDAGPYTLGDHRVQVNPYLGPGSATAEAYFHIDLGFDFLSEYGADSAEDFFVQARLSSVAGGPEEFFLSYSATESANAGAPVPEPGTLLLGGMGLLGFFGLRRSGRKRNQAG